MASPRRRSPTSRCDRGRRRGGVRAARPAARAGEPLPSFNDLVIKACALALRAHPRANGAYATATSSATRASTSAWPSPPRARSWCRPIFDADSKRLARSRGDARAGRQGPRRLGHARRSSRRHIHGLQPGHVRRVALHRRDQPAPGRDPRGRGGAARAPSSRADGSFASRRILTLTLSADHRILYGADAAAFLGTVRERLERPAGLLL